jgi:serine/threonine-protein kinase RsbW
VRSGSERVGTRLHFRLPADPRAVAAARRCLSTLSEEFVEPRMLTVLQLLVTELVTNSLRHATFDGDPWVEVNVLLEDHSVKVEVIDPGPGFERPAPVEASSKGGGWGLYLVDKLSHRWGVTLDGRTRVWFEIDDQSDSPLYRN